MNFFFLILFICIILYLIDSSNYNYKYKSNEHFDTDLINDPSPEQKMKSSSIIIGGTCRDVGGYINSIIESIDKCGYKFAKYHVIIYENDSSDDTREKLIKLKKNNYTYIFDDGLTDKIKSRTKRLEYGRNIVINQLRYMCKKESWDYFLNLDMDNVNAKGTFVNTIEKCFDPSVNNSWAVQTANQVVGYYDRWALRIPKFFNYDCWLKIKKHGRNDQNVKKYVYPDVDFSYNSNGLLIPVNSAFGGTALYKIKSIPSYCKYNGTHLTGEEKCEHVDFHKCIRGSGGKIYINTLFLNDG
jgi:hypothetical protein